MLLEHELKPQRNRCGQRERAFSDIVTMANALSSELDADIERAESLADLAAQIGATFELDHAVRTKGVVGHVLATHSEPGQQAFVRNMEEQAPKIGYVGKVIRVGDDIGDSNLEVEFAVGGFSDGDESTRLTIDKEINCTQRHKGHGKGQMKNLAQKEYIAAFSQPNLENKLKITIERFIITYVS